MSTATRFPVVPGSQVLFLGQIAMVLEVREPDNPDSAIDIVYVDPSTGSRRIESNVHRGPERGAYLTVAEIEADQPETPQQAIQAAKMRGEPVPEPGMIARVAINIGESMQFLVVPMRLQITEVHSLTRVSGWLLADRAEGDYEGPDIRLQRLGNVRHVSEAGEFERAENYLDMWEHVGEGVIAPRFGPISTVDAHPPHVCGAPACGKRTKHLRPLDLAPVLGIGQPLMVCPECLDSVRELLGIEVAEEPPVPTSGLSMGPGGFPVSLDPPRPIDLALARVLPDDIEIYSERGAINDDDISEVRRRLGVVDAA